jgi:hypothetical protein
VGASQARCFVVQGFGRKTNYTDGRELDLGASYAVIKKAVEAAGHERLRADEIKHSGTVRQDILRYVGPQLDDLDELRADKRYWMLASLWEVNVGLGRGTDATRWEQEARAVAPSSAMVQMTEQHIARTRETQAALDATLAAAV